MIFRPHSTDYTRNHGIIIQICYKKTLSFFDKKWYNILLYIILWKWLFMKHNSTKYLRIICGHYGSGKTNVAVNLALQSKNDHPSSNVYLADLDIVNPYFRSADAADLLEVHGVNVLIPEFANTNVDIPSLPTRLSSLITTPGENDIVYVDVGGDDGAIALGRYRSYIPDDAYELIYVINMFRPLTATPEEAMTCMQEIEALSGLKCTKIINNSSLGADTTASDILSTVTYAKETAALCSLPLAAHTYCPAIVPDLEAELEKHGLKNEPFMPIELATKKLF